MTELPDDGSRRYARGGVPEAERSRLRRQLGLSDVRKQLPWGLPLYSDQELAEAIIELLEAS